MYGRINLSTIHMYTFSHQESQIRVLGKEDFSVGSGPFVQALDKALKTFNVERQAYYSGTFIGNHVHRTLKVMNIKKRQIIHNNILRHCIP